MQTVLIVEDEWLVGEGLKVDLEERGFTVLGPALNCKDAMAILSEHTAELASSTPSWGNETCQAVVDECDKRGIPVVVFSGHSDEGLPDFARGRKVLAKPYLPRSLETFSTTSLGNGSKLGAETCLFRFGKRGDQRRLSMTAL